MTIQPSREHARHWPYRIFEPHRLPAVGQHVPAQHTWNHILSRHFWQSYAISNHVSCVPLRPPDQGHCIRSLPQKRTKVPLPSRVRQIDSPDIGQDSLGVLPLRLLPLPCPAGSSSTTGRRADGSPPGSYSIGGERAEGRSAGEGGCGRSPVLEQGMGQLDANAPPLVSTSVSAVNTAQSGTCGHPATLQPRSKQPGKNGSAWPHRSSGPSRRARASSTHHMITDRRGPPRETRPGQKLP
jgi:hypothetical protein